MDVLVRVTFRSVHIQYSAIAFLSHDKDENISLSLPPKVNCILIRMTRMFTLGGPSNKHANEVRHCAFSSSSPRDGGRELLPYSCHRMMLVFTLTL